MIEVYIERWTGHDGSHDYRWSVWRDGRRVELASTVTRDAALCEAEALRFCRETLGQTPDRVTRL